MLTAAEHLGDGEISEAEPLTLLSSWCRPVLLSGHLTRASAFLRERHPGPRTVALWDASEAPGAHFKVVAASVGTAVGSFNHNLSHRRAACIALYAELLATGSPS